jgi:hypothetical protein
MISKVIRAATLSTFLTIVASDCSLLAQIATPRQPGAQGRLIDIEKDFPGFGGSGSIPTAMYISPLETLQIPEGSKLSLQMSSYGEETGARNRLTAISCSTTRSTVSASYGIGYGELARLRSTVYQDTRAPGSDIRSTS